MKDTSLTNERGKNLIDFVYLVVFIICGFKFNKITSSCGNHIQLELAKSKTSYLNSKFEYQLHVYKVLLRKDLFQGLSSWSTNLKLSTLLIKWQKTTSVPKHYDSQRVWFRTLYFAYNWVMVLKQPSWWITSKTDRYPWIWLSNGSLAEVHAHCRDRII